MQIVDALLKDGITMSVSDIHLEPQLHQVRIRFRIDGILYDQSPIPLPIAQQVCARIEILAGIDGTKRRIPQDGKFSVEFEGTTIDFRVSTFPSLYGPTIVVRILDRLHNTVELSKLGFSENMLAQFQQLIHQSSGFFLVSGPTGSGKTTTLYGVLTELNTAEKNIITLEDPVEYILEGITQGHIFPIAGFTFEKGLRALLRQDPDIILVGEIRDKQTAHVAIEASLTGHLVLSTVHTADAVCVIMRLMEMGIEPFLINAALTGVLAQRLVRTICNHCKREYEPTEQERAIIKKASVAITKLYKGEGCQNCNYSGYKGRTGIFELLVMSHAFRALIVQHPSVEQLYVQAHAEGMSTLFQNGMQKVLSGITTLSELFRAIS